MSDFYYGQGKLYLARRNMAGQALSWRWVGDVSALSLEIEFDEKKTKASVGGRLVDSQRFISGVSGKVTSTWHEYSKENLQVLLSANLSNRNPNLVSSEALPLGIRAGDRISLRNPNIFAVTIPTLKEGVDYLVDGLWGVINFIRTPAQQPVVVDYGHAGHASLPLMDSIGDELSLRYEGINLAEKQSRVIVELYRISMDLLQSLPLIHIDSNLGGLETSALVLHDATKLADPSLGQFGRVMQISLLNGITHNGAISYNGYNSHGGQ